VPFAAESFMMIDASITAFNALAVGLIVRMLCAQQLIAYLVVPLFLFLGLAIRTLAAAILIGPNEALGGCFGADHVVAAYPSPDDCLFSTYGGDGAGQSGTAKSVFNGCLGRLAARAFFEF
jgi:hypothetical protein